MSDSKSAETSTTTTSQTDRATQVSEHGLGVVLFTPQEVVQRIRSFKEHDVCLPTTFQELFDAVACYYHKRYGIDQHDFNRLPIVFEQSIRKQDPGSNTHKLIFRDLDFDALIWSHMNGYPTLYFVAKGQSVDAARLAADPMYSGFFPFGSFQSEFKPTPKKANHAL